MPSSGMMSGTVAITRFHIARPAAAIASALVHCVCIAIFILITRRFNTIVIDRTGVVYIAARILITGRLNAVVIVRAGVVYITVRILITGYSGTVPLILALPVYIADAVLGAESVLITGSVAYYHSFSFGRMPGFCICHI